MVRSSEAMASGEYSAAKVARLAGTVEHLGVQVDRLLREIDEDTRLAGKRAEQLAEWRGEVRTKLHAHAQEITLLKAQVSELEKSVSPPASPTAITQPIDVSAVKRAEADERHAKIVLYSKLGGLVAGAGTLIALAIDWVRGQLGG